MWRESHRGAVSAQADHLLLAAFGVYEGLDHRGHHLGAGRVESLSGALVRLYYRLDRVVAAEQTEPVWSAWS